MQKESFQFKVARPHWLDLKYHHQPAYRYSCIIRQVRAAPLIKRSKAQDSLREQNLIMLEE